MKTILVLFGGESTEHAISLKTGRFIFYTLDRTKYKVKPILITQRGKWLIPESEVSDLPQISGQEDYPLVFEKEFRKLGVIESLGLPWGDRLGDVVFLGLHGGNGENGNIQAYLTLLGIPFTGSEVLASALAMDKEKANYLFQSQGLMVAPFFTVTKQTLEGIAQDMNSHKMSFPVFVKPNQGGSSVGAGIAHDMGELKVRLESVFALEYKAIVQNLVKGVEVSCGVIEYPDQAVPDVFTPSPLFPTEIVPKSDFFDFHAKYQGKSEEITPARLSAELTSQVRAMAVLAHKVLGCKGYSRSDFLIQNEIPFILETNTLPGMTETSLIPQQVAYQGKNMKDVLDILIARGLSGTI